tara:strand:+ start:672 stop:869 length:198 start_codon:yes stop_codon:yes gene_type:complete
MNKTSFFDKKLCLETINNLKKFYERDDFKIKPDKELNLLKNVIEDCFKEKCPTGYYYLHGECLPG